MGAGWKFETKETFHEREEGGMDSSWNKKSINTIYNIVRPNNILLKQCEKSIK